MKKIRNYLFALALAVICVTGFSVTAHAATTLANLKVGTTYKCDMNADSKADTLKWTLSNASNGSKYLNVYVNGKRRFYMNGYAFRGVWYYRTNAANEYLLVRRAFAGGGSQYVVFHCKKTGIVKLGALPFAYYTGNPVTTNGEIRYATSPKYEFGGCYLGKMKMLARVKIANGKLMYVTRYARCYGDSTYYIARNNFYLVTGAGHTKSNGVLVRAGDEIKFVYGYFRNNKVYYRVMVNGKAGWLPTTAKIR
ncbi:MAG: hypothetical protein Q4B47_05075 [Eubacteriales bacterium]|nr:hypothetical protein [Eubacteriales bacterium]